MAESPMDIERRFQSEDDRFRHADDPSQLISVDADSGGDADDYSSGSDRSIGAEDDLSLHDSNSTSIDQAEADAGVRSKRKRRYGSHGSRRQKGGSRHKHKGGFHPYPPQEEIKRKSLEIKEKENAAAEIRRDDGDLEFVKFPTAPFNSTQFLMDEHNVASPVGLQKTPSSSKLEILNNTPCTLVSVQATPKHIETPDNANNVDRSNPNPKVNKEFTEIYTTLHAESLQSLPKEELVKHYMNLEEQVAVLQKKVDLAEQKKVETSKTDGEGDKESDSASVCDTNSLSSSNEEYVDLAAVNQPTISVGDTEVEGQSLSRHQKDS